MDRRVLIVDDEKLIVKGLKFSLEQDNMEVDVAYDGREALEKAMNNQYDIILLDVMLPELNGFEVCQQVRDFSDVPIIMLTAKGDDMDTGLTIILQNRLTFLRLRRGLRRLCVAWEKTSSRPRIHLRLSYLVI